MNYNKGKFPRVILLFKKKWFSTDNYFKGHQAMSKNIFVVVATTEEMCIKRAGARNDVQHSIMHTAVLLRTITCLRMTHPVRILASSRLAIPHDLINSLLGRLNYFIHFRWF